MNSIPTNKELSRPVLSWMDQAKYHVMAHVLANRSLGATSTKRIIFRAMRGMISDSELDRVLLALEEDGVIELEKMSISGIGRPSLIVRSLLTFPKTA